MFWQDRENRRGVVSMPRFKAYNCDQNAMVVINLPD